MSAQSWFWSDGDQSTLAWINPVNGKREVKWYLYPEMDCPIELTTAFTIRTFDRGGVLVQYELPQYFFNYHSSRSYSYVLDVSENYESEPDYSGKLKLKRFIDYMLDIDSARKVISTNMSDYYDTDRVRWEQNQVDDPAKDYYQVTMGAVGTESKFIDRYTADMAAWHEQNLYRFNDRMLTADMLTRINLTFSSIDETLALKSVEGGYVAEFYNSNAGLIRRDETTFMDNEAGRVIAITTLNSITEYVDTVEVDSDEILVLRRNALGRVKGEVYKVKAYGLKTKHEFRLEKVSDGTELYGNAGLDSVVGVASVRESNTIDLNCLRQRDSGLLLISLIGSNMQLSGKLHGASVNRTVPLNGTFVYACATDIDGDKVDELAVMTESGGEYRIDFYTLSDGSFTELDDSIELGEGDYRTLFTQRYTRYNKTYRL